MVPASLPVVVRVKRKRDLEPVDTIVVEAEETPAAKRRARDAALAAELDAVLAGAMEGGEARKVADAARAHAGVDDAAAPATATRPNRRRFRRVQMTLSVADASDYAVVRELARTVAVASSSKKRAMPEVIDTLLEPTLSSQGYLEASRLEASLSRTKKRATTLRRPAPRTADIGADAMEGHFRMYELEAGGDDMSSGGGKGTRNDDVTLMSNYLPMVREFLQTPDAAESSSEADEFVYDVYVADDDAMQEGEDDPTDLMNEITKLTFAGGTDAAYFFDAMDGLLEDLDDDDADSQDSNREDAPVADYPEDEDSEEDSESGDEDAWGWEQRRQTTASGYGFWPGFGRQASTTHHDGNDDSDYDVEEDDNGFAAARARGGAYRETAYDPRYDDVGGEETYY
ncbi:transcription factor Iwr1 [bacterium]|jgi:hypothetical protein|nr:transcription factor Iwr1 [bacterium]